MVTGSDGPCLHTASRNNNLFDARLCAMQIIQFWAMLFPAYAHCSAQAAEIPTGFGPKRGRRAAKFREIWLRDAG